MLEFTYGKWADTAAGVPLDDEEPMLELAPGQDRCLFIPPEATTPLRVTIRLNHRTARQYHGSVLLEAVLCGRCLPARLLMAGRQVAASSSSGDAMALDLVSLAKEEDWREEGMQAVVEVDTSTGGDARLPAVGTLRLNLWSAEEEAGSAGASRLLASERILLLPEDCALAAQEVSSCCNDDLLADLTIVVESAFGRRPTAPSFAGHNVLQSTTADLLDWAAAGNSAATALLLGQCARRNAERYSGTSSALAGEQQQHSSPSDSEPSASYQHAARPDSASLPHEVAEFHLRAAALQGGKGQQQTVAQQGQRSAVLQAVVHRSFEGPISPVWAAIVVLHALLSVMQYSFQFGYSECGWPLAVINWSPVSVACIFSAPENLKCCNLLPLSLSFYNPSSICLQNSTNLFF